jgi:hypothetical protein
MCKGQIGATYIHRPKYLSFLCHDNTWDSLLTLLKCTLLAVERATQQNRMPELAPPSRCDFCTCWSISPFLVCPPRSSLWKPPFCSAVDEFDFCRFYMEVRTYGICLFVPGLFHLAWHLLGSYMLLQMTEFPVFFGWRKKLLQPGTVAFACNPNYVWGWDGGSQSNALSEK